MAILKDLIVSGSSRLLGKLYANDIEIGNDVEVDGKTTTAQLYVKTTMNNNTNSSVDSNNLPFVVGTISGKHIVMDSDEITAKSGTTGTSNLWINYGGGQVNLGNGGKVNVNDGTLSAHILKASTSLGATNAYVPNAYITTAAITTANTNTINNADMITTSALDVKGKLHAVEYDLENIMDLGGSFVVAPTLIVPSSGSGTKSLTVTKSNNTTVVMTIRDPSITSGGIAGFAWANNYKVKVSGLVNNTVLGTCDGYINTTNVSSNTISLTVTMDAETVTAIATTVSTYKLNIMLYNTDTSSATAVTKPLGIYLQHYQLTNNPIINVWNGQTTTPKVRIGYLGGITYNGSALGTNAQNSWGLYSDSVFLEGQIIANGGKIGGYSIGTANLTKGTTQNASGSFWLTPEGQAATMSALINSSQTWAQTIGQNFGVTTAGVLYATGATITGNIKAQSFSALDTNKKERATVNTNGFIVKDASGNTVASLSNDLTLGQVVANKYNVFIDADVGVQNRKNTSVLSQFDSTSIKFYDGSGTAAGNITAQFSSSGATIGKTSSNHVLLSSSQLQLKNGGTVLAEYGSTVTIGETGSGKYNTYIDGNGVYMRKATTTLSKFDGNGVYFYDGSTITSQFTSSGVNIGKINESQINVYSNSIQITNPQGAEIFSVNSDGAQVSGGMVERKTLAVAGGTSTTATTVEHVARITESVETGMNIDVTFDNITEGLTRTWSVIKGTAVTNIGQYTEMSLTYDGQNNFSFNFNNHWTGKCRIELRCILSSIPTPTYSLGTRGNGQRGAFSTIIGEDLIASGRGQVIIGEKNEEDPDKVFIIGGGFNYNSGSGEIQEFRDNILTVDWNGNVQCGNMQCGDVQCGDMQCDNIKCGYITGQLIQNNNHREYTVTFDEPFPDSGPLPIVVASLVAQSSDTGYADVTVSVGTRTRSDCKIHIFNKSGSGRTPHLMWMATTAGCQEQ